MDPRLPEDREPDVGQCFTKRQSFTDAEFQYDPAGLDERREVASDVEDSTSLSGASVDRSSSHGVLSPYAFHVRSSSLC
jgi:hypothetical protein